MPGASTIDPPSAATPAWRALYPFESHFHSLADHRMHYVDEGQGAPILMVHGNPTWSFYWRNLVLGLRDAWRTVVPDHLGCGLSDKPQQYPYRLSQHIANLASLIEHLNLRDITLLVHDWGGAIGLGAAVQMPDRFRRLVFFNTGAFPPPFIPWRIRACRMPILGPLAVRGLNLFARAALTMATEKPERMTADVAAGLVAPYNNWANRVAVQKFVDDIPTSRTQQTWQRLAEIEQKLPMFADRPVQMLWGMRDWCFNPTCLERLLQSLPHAEVHRFEDAGHYVVEDAYEKIIPIVRNGLKRH